MRKRKIQTLLIEKDHEEALRLLDLAHRAEHIEIGICWERSLGDAREFASGCDVIVVGGGGSWEVALDTLDEIRGSATAAAAAVVMIADSADRADALEAIRRGAQDYVARAKLTPSRLERTLEYALERHRATSALASAAAEYRGLFENALEGLYRSSPDGRLLSANPALVRMLGYESLESLLAIDLRDLYVNPEDRQRWLDRLSVRDEIRSSEAVLRRRNGEPLTVLETSRAVRSEEGETLCFEGSLLDITERKKYERHLEYLVNHDSLTGLLSRRRFLQDLEREVERARRYGTFGSLLLIDLDDFKGINDTFGHHVGDEILSIVGRLLKNRLRQTDLAARLGGDEFAVLTPQTGLVEAQTVAAALLDTLWNNTVKTDGQRHRVGASIGVAPIDWSCPDAESVLVRADNAMYLAKSNGGRECRIYRAPEDRAEAGRKAG